MTLMKTGPESITSVWRVVLLVRHIVTTWSAQSSLSPVCPAAKTIEEPVGPSPATKALNGIVGERFTHESASKAEAQGVRISPYLTIQLDTKPRGP